MNTKFLLRLYKLVGEITEENTNIEFYSVLRSIMKQISSDIELNYSIDLDETIRNSITGEIDDNNIKSSMTSDIIDEKIEKLLSYSTPKFKAYSITDRKSHDHFIATDVYIAIYENGDTDIYSFINDDIITKAQFLSILNRIVLQVNSISNSFS